MPPRFPTVVFDLDGTLVDSYEALTNAINHVRGAENLEPFTADRVRGIVGEGMERLLQRVFEPGPVPDHAPLNFEAKYDELCAEQSRILDDVVPALSQLREAGILMAVCTNKPTGFSRKIVESLGIAGFFAAVVGPDATGARKPQREHVAGTLERAGHNGGPALFVGDMTIDIAAARNAALPVAVIATGSSPAGELRAAKPDYFLEQFSDVVAIVLGDER